MNIDLTKIKDIQELKALKADQYDVAEHAQAQYQQARQGISFINARISEIEQTEAKSEARQSKS